MSVANLRNIINARTQQYGDIFNTQKNKDENFTELFAALFKYLEASNAQVTKCFEEVRKNQKKILSILSKDDKK